VALTKGFKKFIGLLAIVAAVGGGGMYYYKTMKQHPQSDVSSSTSDTGQSSIDYATPSSQPQVVADPVQPETSTVESPTSAPVTQSQDSAPSNSGMAALLNAGKKKQ
jgi:hypothetical protein